MKIVTLSVAAALVVASFGIADAKQISNDRLVPISAAQDQATTGRSVGVQGQGSLYDANGPQTYGRGRYDAQLETLSPARGPYQVY